MAGMTHVVHQCRRSVGELQLLISGDTGKSGDLLHDYDNLVNDRRFNLERANEMAHLYQSWSRSRRQR